MATPEEIARAEAEAEAEAEFAFADTGFGGSQPDVAASGPPAANGFMDGFGGWGDLAQSVAMAPVNLVKGVASLPGAVEQGVRGLSSFLVGSTTGIDPASLKDASGNFDPNATAQPYDTRGAVVSGLKGVRDVAAGSLGLKTLAQYASGEDVTPAQWGNEAREYIAQAPLAYAPQIAGMAKGGYQAARDFTIGQPKASRLAKAAGNDEIFANTLNVGQGRTNAERMMVERGADSADAFVGMGALDDIDPTTGRQGFVKFRQNLETAKTQAVLTRDDVVNTAAQAEATQIAAAQAAGQPVKAGLEFSDLPTTVANKDGLAYGLKNIEESIPEGVEGVRQASNFLSKEFQVMPTYPQGMLGPVVYKTQKPLSIVEANTLRKKIDGQIREWGGYDDAFMAAMKISPSAQKGYVAAMKFYRSQLDEAVKSRISTLVNPEAGAAFKVAGENYSAATDFSHFAERFQNETGQAFTPGSAKAMPPGGGMFENRNWGQKGIDAVAPGRRVAKMESQALSREGNAIQTLQQLIEFRTQPELMSLPRGWAQIKTSAQNMNNFAQAAMSLGIINGIEQIMSLPDEAGKELVKMVAGQAPQIFTPTPDGINAVDGEYGDPMSRDAMVKKSLSLPPAERAKIVGSSFENKYVPSTQASPLPAMLATPAPAMTDLGALNQSLSMPELSPLPPDRSYDGSHRDVMAELEASQMRHNEDFN